MTDNLKQAAEAFRQWRSNRPNRSRTPEHLQLLAVNQLSHLEKTGRFNRAMPTYGDIITQHRRSPELIF